MKENYRIVFKNYKYHIEVLATLRIWKRFLYWMWDSSLTSWFPISTAGFPVCEKEMGYEARRMTGTVFSLDGFNTINEADDRIKQFIDDGKKPYQLTQQDVYFLNKKR